MDYYGPESRVCHSIRASIDKVISLAPENSIFVESGAYLGHTTKHFIDKLLRSGKTFKYFVIDNWLLDNVTERHNDNLQFFKENLGDLLKYVNIISSDSLEAISKFEDNSVFYCFLDDNHTYQHVVRQIPMWLPKMKDFSILSGDDYYCDGVQEAVKKYFDLKDVEVLDNYAGFLIENPISKLKGNYDKFHSKS